MTGIDGSSFF